MRTIDECKNFFECYEKELNLMIQNSVSTEEISNKSRDIIIDMYDEAKNSLDINDEDIKRDPSIFIPVWIRVLSLTNRFCTDFMAKYHTDVRFLFNGLENIIQTERGNQNDSEGSGKQS